MMCNKCGTFGGNCELQGKRHSKTSQGTKCGGMWDHTLKVKLIDCPACGATHKRMANEWGHPLAAPCKGHEQNARMVYEWGQVLCTNVHECARMCTNVHEWGQVLKYQFSELR